jgi:hypothetical protein
MCINSGTKRYLTNDAHTRSAEKPAELILPSPMNIKQMNEGYNMYRESPTSLMKQSQYRKQMGMTAFQVRGSLARMKKDKALRRRNLVEPLQTSYSQHSNNPDGSLTRL